MKRLPKSFQVGPHEISVKVVSKSEMEALDDTIPLGFWERDQNVMYIQKAHRGMPLTVQLHTFWHEFTHCQLELLGYDELSEDEAFVDQMASVLTQSHLSFKF